MTELTLDFLTATAARSSSETVADRLVEEILAQRELLHAENNELVVERRPIETLPFLEKLAPSYESQPFARDRKVVIDPESEPLTFHSDPVLMGRVIANMLKNALEASKAGDSVTLRCVRRGGEVEFSVHNPVPMKEEVMLQVFQRSFSTKGRSRGLGTYGMKLIGERYLKGRISFASTPEEGTTFLAVFPEDLPPPEVAAS